MEAKNETKKRFAELKAAGELPSPKGVALSILELCQKEDTSVEELARVAQADPALTGRVLKLANSPLVGLSRPVASIKDAIIVLGVQVFRQITVGLSVLSSTHAGPCRAFDYPAFWSRSLATGVAAQSLCARENSGFSPAEVFTCGLLSSIGTLALATIHPCAYAEILENVPDFDPDTLLKLEQERFQTHHAELTSALLEDWGLPEVQVAAARYHERPHISGLTEGSRAQKLANILHLASHLGRLCAATDDLRAAWMGTLLNMAEANGIAPGELKCLFEQLIAEWTEWGSLLRVKTRAGATFDEIAERAEDLLPPSEERVKILLVDPLSSELPEELARLGHDVRSTADGEQVLPLVVETEPHVVILRHAGTGTGAVRLCRTLRVSYLGGRLQIMLLLDTDDEKLILEAAEAGADQLIRRPYSAPVLDAYIRVAERAIRSQKEAENQRIANRSELAELAVTNRRLHERALTDPLTGLPNRRHVLMYLEKQWAAASRSGLPLSCLMLDIDHFKRVNDLYGHDAGDIALRSVAAAVRDTVRTSDFIGRYGGEEFLCVCPNTEAGAARKLAERVRQTVMFTPENPHPVTVSIGVVTRHKGIAAPDHLIEAADHAMLLAKRSGRNRVCEATLRAVDQSQTDCSLPARRSTTN